MSGRTSLADYLKTRRRTTQRTESVRAMESDPMGNSGLAVIEKNSKVPFGNYVNPYLEQEARNFDEKDFSTMTMAEARQFAKEQNEAIQKRAEKDINYLAKDRLRNILTETEEEAEDKLWKQNHVNGGTIPQLHAPIPEDIGRMRNNGTRIGMEMMEPEFMPNTFFEQRLVLESHFAVIRDFAAHSLTLNPNDSYTLKEFHKMFQEVKMAKHYGKFCVLNHVPCCILSYMFAGNGRAYVGFIIRVSDYDAETMKDKDPFRIATLAEFKLMPPFKPIFFACSCNREDLGLS